MKKSELFNEFCNLIHFYEGVELEENSTLNQHFIIRMRIADAKSMVRFEFFCYAANVHSISYAESMVGDADSAAEALRRLVWHFRFRIEPDETEADLPESFKIFVIYMIWDLQKRRVLSNHESKRLLSLWGGQKGTFNRW